MNVKILMDSDVELYNERVESSAVGPSGEEDWTCGEIEVSANREESTDGLLHEFEHKRIFHTANGVPSFVCTLCIARENRNLPHRELVRISWLNYTLW